MVISLIFFGENFQYSNVSFSFIFQYASISYAPSGNPTYSHSGIVYHLFNISRLLVLYCFTFGPIFDFFDDFSQYSNVSFSLIFQIASIGYTTYISPKNSNYSPVYQLSGITRFFAIYCCNSGQ